MTNTMTQEQPEQRGSAHLSVEGADRLDSWKEIARYLDRNVRTIQRWETFESLPIHRQFHRKSGTVHGFKTEIDAWRKNRSYRKEIDREQKRSLRFESYSVPAIEKQRLRKLLEAALAELIAQSSISAPILAPDTQAIETIAADGKGSGEAFSAVLLLRVCLQVLAGAGCRLPR